MSEAFLQYVWQHQLMCLNMLFTTKARTCCYP